MSEQFVMWLDRGLQKKAVGIQEAERNLRVVAKIVGLEKQIEATKYSHSTNMVQMSLPICVTCRVNHQSIECSSTNVDMSSPEQATYAQNFQRQQINLYSQTYNLE
ncbi:Uncharacterized protein Adt_42065 [Abeliophyllum distichum]|uniref:Uncharacterized protein n=1 Tax=Abeliophyllum distichum TaxID=126358 RepID=A0ABD1PRG2_9LAMI